jgi:hypothetical protein
LIEIGGLMGMKKKKTEREMRGQNAMGDEGVKERESKRLRHVRERD